MDRITRLSDDVLLNILSFLPTQVAVSTSILSKRWEFLWMWLPKLKLYGGFLPLTDWDKLKCFLDSKLPLHRAPVIESFRLSFFIPEFERENIKPENIKLWLVIAISRQLRELDIYYINREEKSDILPSSLYNCKSLVTLKLFGYILLDVPRMVCLPSLKTLQVEKVTILPGESLGRLLSICPVLENLLLDTSHGHDSGKIRVIIPSLQSLTLILPCKGNIEGLEIRTPSLKYLKLDAHDNDIHPFSIGHMPKLEEAYVNASFRGIKSLMRSMASVKRLRLCLPAPYGDGVIFNQLEHLKLCDCRMFSLNVLTRLLNDSPRLRVLNIFQMENHDRRILGWWNRPTSVPKCILSSLETLNWSGYLGREQERSVVFYMLSYARHLKIANICSEEVVRSKYEMLRDLSCSSRASTLCRLLFS